MLDQEKGPLRQGLVEIDSQYVNHWEGTMSSVEMSAMPNRGIALVQRLWELTNEEGFLVRSQKTGVVRIFELAHEQRDSEGDTQYWIFESNYQVDKRHSIKMGVMARTLAIKIFND